MAWEDHRVNNRGDIYCTCSRDAGVNWLTNDVQLNDDAGVWYQSRVRLCSDGARAVFGWMDQRHHISIEDLYVTATIP